mmetsp:Transcript_1836/g.5527  ORF Transcript_1836/g.5527 Transcript_1836/m.5527 type:complete len:254 (+) Transcript_1836:1267-2028(+)
MRPDPQKTPRGWPRQRKQLTGIQLDSIGSGLQEPAAMSLVLVPVESARGVHEDATRPQCFPGACKQIPLELKQGFQPALPTWRAPVGQGRRILPRVPFTGARRIHQDSIERRRCHDANVAAVSACDKTVGCTGPQQARTQLPPACFVRLVRYQDALLAKPGCQLGRLAPRSSTEIQDLEASSSVDTVLRQCCAQHLHWQHRRLFLDVDLASEVGPAVSKLCALGVTFNDKTGRAPWHPGHRQFAVTEPLQNPM